MEKIIFNSRNSKINRETVEIIRERFSRKMGFNNGMVTILRGNDRLAKLVKRRGEEVIQIVSKRDEIYYRHFSSSLNREKGSNKGLEEEIVNQNSCLFFSRFSAADRLYNLFNTFRGWSKYHIGDISTDEMQVDRNAFYRGIYNIISLFIIFIVIKLEQFAQTGKETFKSRNCVIKYTRFKVKSRAVHSVSIFLYFSLVWSRDACIWVSRLITEISETNQRVSFKGFLKINSRPNE